MKQVLLVLVMTLLFAGCTGETEPVFETVGNVSYEQGTPPAAQTIYIDVPDEATAQTMAGEDSPQIYTWEGYELRVETMEAGNVDATIQTITGLPAEKLTVMEQKIQDLNLYQTVWSTAGEEGVLLGRAMIADDGNYHYCVSLVSPEEVDSSQLYAQIVGSFSLSDSGGLK